MTKGKEISVDGMVRVTRIPILYYIVDAYSHKKWNCSYRRYLGLSPEDTV